MKQILLLLLLPYTCLGMHKSDSRVESKQSGSLSDLRLAWKSPQMSPLRSSASSIERKYYKLSKYKKHLESYATSRGSFACTSISSVKSPEGTVYLLAPFTTSNQNITNESILKDIEILIFIILKELSVVQNSSYDDLIKNYKYITENASLEDIIQRGFSHLHALMVALNENLESLQK